MDLVDEKDVAFFEARQQSGEFPGFFDDGAAGVFHIHAHRIGDDVGERGFAQPGRTAEQNVLKDVASFFGRLHQKFEPFADFHLAGELAEHRRPQRDFESGIRLRRFHWDKLLTMDR